MLSGVLKSKLAVQVNIEIMRAFVRYRKMLVSDERVLKRLKPYWYLYNDWGQIKVYQWHLRRDSRLVKLYIKHNVRKIQFCCSSRSLRMVSISPAADSVPFSSSTPRVATPRTKGTSWVTITKVVSSLRLTSQNVQ